MGFAHDGDVGDIEVGGSEHVELALQVEIEEALDGAVGGYDAGGDAGVLRLELNFGPIFVARAFDAAAGGNGETAVGSGIFGAGTERGFGDLLGGHGVEFLAIVFVDAKSEANALEADFYGLIGVVAESDLNGEDAGSERRFLGKRLLVERGVQPGLGGDGHAFVGFEGGGVDGRRLLLGEGECGGGKTCREYGGCDGRKCAC